MQRHGSAIRDLVPVKLTELIMHSSPCATACSFWQLFLLRLFLCALGTETGTFSSRKGGSVKSSINPLWHLSFNQTFRNNSWQFHRYVPQETQWPQFQVWQEIFVYLWWWQDDDVNNVLTAQKTPDPLQTPHPLHRDSIHPPSYCWNLIFSHSVP